MSVAVTHLLVGVRASMRVLQVRAQSQLSKWHRGHSTDIILTTHCYLYSIAY
jgi:hypothetical protein